MSDPTPARLLGESPEGVPYIRLSSEMIPHGLSLVFDKHRGVPGELTTDKLDLFLVSAGTKMESVVPQFSSKPAANGGILDFCLRNEDVILPLFKDEKVMVLCAPATTFADRGKAPERLLVLGLKVKDVKAVEGQGRLEYIRLPYDKAPPDGTHVLLLK